MKRVVPILAGQSFSSLTCAKQQCQKSHDISPNCHREAPAKAPWRTESSLKRLRAPRDCVVTAFLAMTWSGPSARITL